MQAILKIPKFTTGQDKVYVNDPDYFHAIMTSSTPLFVTDISQHEMVKKEAITYYKLKVRSTNTNTTFELIFNVPEEFSDTVRFVHNTYIEDDDDDDEESKKEKTPDMIFVWKCESEATIEWKKSISKIIDLFTYQLQRNCTFNNEEPEILPLALNDSTLLNYHHKKITANDFYTTFNPVEDTYQIILAGGYWAHGRNEIGVSWQIPCFKGMTKVKLFNHKIKTQNKRRKRPIQEVENQQNEENSTENSVTVEDSFK